VSLEVRSDLRIARSRSDVFAFLTDTTSFPILDRALVDYSPRGLLSPGLTGTFAHRRAGMTARTTWRVEELEPPARLRVSIRGMGYAMEESADLVADGSGTRVVFIDRVWPTSLYGRLLVALSGGIMRRDLRDRAMRLKSILESGRADAEAEPQK
jgi:hypothetical protein